jgi:hypothetical protein
MGLKHRKAAVSDGPFIPGERLWQQMSEVISMREKVAQAELAARRYGPSIKEKAPAPTPASTAPDVIDGDEARS